MKRFAVVFPGQGAQEIGMGRDLWRGGDAFTEQLAQFGGELAGTDLARLCQRGPVRQLDDTRYLQPAMTVVCLGLWRLLDVEGLRPTCVAGHSLGELPALVTAGIISARTVVELAVERGACMAEAAQRSDGGMIAITGDIMEPVHDLVAKSAKRGIISVAAYNGPTQLTLSGEAPLLGEVQEQLRERGGYSVTRLKVSGAWHSGLMAEAEVQFARCLEATRSSWNLDQAAGADAGPRMIFNRGGQIAASVDQAIDWIGGQLTRPVDFVHVVERCRKLGVTDVVEIGPGKVMRGLLRLNDPAGELKIHSLSDRRSRDRLVTALRE